MKDLLALALLAVLDLAMFGGVLWTDGRRVLGAEHTDMFAQFAAWRAFGFGEIARGHFPLWNPHVYSGAPFFGGMQSALLYPPHLLFLVLPLGAALNWTYALHAWLFGALVFAWGRVRGLSIPAAFFAGVLFMFGGTHLPQIYGGHPSYVSTMAWAPLILCALDGWIEARRFEWLLLGAGAVALHLLGGHPQYVYFTAITAGFYTLVRSWRAAPALIAIYAGGALLAAVQLLTAFQASSESVRSGALPYEFASQFALPPENLLTLVAPDVFGTLDRYWGRCYLWEMSLFAGVAGTALALYAVVQADRRRAWPLAAACGFALVMALGNHTPLHELLYHHVPGFSRFRGLSKFAFPGSVFLAMLSGTGLDALMRGGPPRRRFVLGAGAAALALLVAGASVRNTAPGDWRGWYRTMLDTRESYRTAADLDDAAAMTRSQGGAARSLAVAGGVAALAAALFLLCRRRREVAWALLALGVAELFVFARGTLVTFELAAIAPDGLRAAARAFPRDSRVMNLSNPNAAMMLGTGDIWGSDPSVVGRYAAFIAWTQGHDPDHATQNVVFQRFDPLYCLLRLGHGVGMTPEGEQHILPAPVPPLPHVSLVSRHRVLRDRDAIFAAMRREDFDPRREVLLESEPEPAPAPGGEAGTVRLVDRTTDALTLEAETTRPALLLVTDVYTPAWKARALPGSAQARYDVMPADYILRAVPLAAGRHRLVLEYAPREFAIGLGISAVALLVWLAAWLRRARELLELIRDQGTRGDAR